MQIRVDRIPEDGQPLEGQVEPSVIDLDLPGYGLTEPITFTGRASKSGEDVIVKGHLTGSVQSQCGRCLNQFEMRVDTTIDTVFVPRIERGTEEVEVVDVEENFSYYDGVSINLVKEIRDLIIVSLPMSPVCREDCKGLCPRCGTDLNEGPCNCGGGSGPSPFDKLKELKAALEKE